MIGTARFAVIKTILLSTSAADMTRVVVMYKRHPIWIIGVVFILYIVGTFDRFHLRSGRLLAPIFSSMNQRNSTRSVKQPSSKHLVVSHFNENLDWIDLLAGLNITDTVYTTSRNRVTRPHVVTNRINKGREAVVYLQYIIENYSNLPLSIAFVHGHRTSWHQENPSDIVLALRAFRWHKTSYMPLTSTRTGSTFTPQANNSQSLVNNEFWRAVLQKELGSPPLSGIHLHCCASFVTRREAILTHPRDFYSSIRNYILGSRHSDYLTGRTLEYSWHMIFGQPANIHFTPCDIFHCNSNGTVSVP